MKHEMLQFGLIACMAAAVHMPLHAQDFDRQARIEAHQKRIEGIITESRERRTSRSIEMNDAATTGLGVKVVASNLPLERVVNQLQDQSGVPIRTRGAVGDVKVTAIFPKEVSLIRVLEQLAESNQLQVRESGNGYEIWDPLEYQRQTQKAKVYTLSESKAEVMANLIQPVLSYRTGSIKSDPTRNTIIVYDVPEKQQAIEELLKQLDQKLTTRVFTLKHTHPKILSQPLVDFCRLERDQIVLDERSSQVILRATTSTLEQAAFLIEILDTPPTAVPGKFSQR